MQSKLKWLWDKVKAHFIQVKELYFFLGLVKLGLSSLGITILPKNWTLVEDIFNLLMVVGVYIGVFKYNPAIDGNILSKERAIQFLISLLKQLIKK